MAIFFLLVIVIASILIVVVFLYVSSIIGTPPKGRAVEFLESDRPKEGRIIVCIGDSLTHGNIGVCWVDSLRQEFTNDKFLNEGINGEVTWQVHQRLEPILACKPDIVTIMIGSNDVMASFDKNSGERYKNNNKLPEIPTFERYKELLPELIDRLKTVPKIAICTLPPVGEYKDSSINNHINKFNEFIRLTAFDKNITLLPVSDLIWTELDNRTYPLKNDYDPNIFPIIRRIFGGIFHHYIFKKSWHSISKSKGQWVLFDQIHLNERGAGVVFNLVRKYISSN
jgi:lysophospholipase L1-like esterase